MDARDAVPLMLPFLIVADLFALRIYWGDWDTDELKRLLPAGALGILMGALLFGVISEAALRVVIAVISSLVLMYRLFGDRLQSIKYEPRTWHGWLAGWSSAVASALANNGGPTMTVYLLLKKLDKVVFIGTVTVFFAAANLAKLPIFIGGSNLTWGQIVNVWWAFPVVPLGVWLGRRSLDYIDQKTFEAIIMILLVISVMLLFVDF